MNVPTLYLDTSVIGGYFDDGWKGATQELWRQMRAGQWCFATSTVARINYLVSWNFKHLVNVQREAGFNGVNLLQGYSPIRIVNPLEIIYANQDQSL